MAIVLIEKRFRTPNRCQRAKGPVDAGRDLIADQLDRDAEPLLPKERIDAFPLVICFIGDPDDRLVRLILTRSGEIDLHSRSDFLNSGHQILMRCYRVDHRLFVRKLVARWAGGVMPSGQRVQLGKRPRPGDRHRADQASHEDVYRFQRRLPSWCVLADSLRPITSHDHQLVAARHVLVNACHDTATPAGYEVNRTDPFQGVRTEISI